MQRQLGALVFVVLVGMGVSATAQADVTSLVRATGPSPFVAGCSAAPQTGTLYRNAEVEPFVDANPLDARNLVAVWQQDRWSTGGARGLLTGVSQDRGRSWTRPTPPTFSRCAGGNAANGGNYERATDPWVSFGPNGDAHQISLSFNDSNPTSAVLVSRSQNNGRTWGKVTTLQRDTVAELFNDKESITADPTDPNYVYAVWDRLQIQNPADPASPFSGDTLFARSTDGGRTWERTKTILDFPDNSGKQTLASQIVVLPNGTLINAFDLIDQGTPQVAVQRSTDKGRTWSDPIIVDLLFSSAATSQGGVIDPSDGHPVRTGDLIPDIAVDPRTGTRKLYLAWQDLRFTLLGAVANDQIVMASSSDGGRTWSDPKRVSANRNVQSFTGSVHVDARGRVGVSYYDFTNDNPAGGPLNTDYWFTASRDGGLTFTPRERLTPAPFNMKTAPDAGGYFLGDYEGLTSVKRRFAPFFVAANSGNLGNRTDGFAALVRPRAGNPAAATVSAQPARRMGAVKLANRGPVIRR